MNPRRKGTFYAIISKKLCEIENFRLRSDEIINQCNLLVKCDSKKCIEMLDEDSKSSNFSLITLIRNHFFNLESLKSAFLIEKQNSLTLEAPRMDVRLSRNFQNSPRGFLTLDSGRMSARAAESHMWGRCFSSCVSLAETHVLGIIRRSVLRALIR